MTAPTDQPRSPRGAFTSSVWRLGILVVLIGGCGAAVGFGMGYPVSKIEIDVRTAEQLNHAQLAGTFDPGASLAALEDLPDGWGPGDPGALGYLNIVGTPICGVTPQIENQLGDPLQVVYSDASGKELLTSQSVRVRSTREANQYIQEMARAFEACSEFFVLSDGERTKIDIRPGQPSPPVTDYVSRTLVVADSGLTRRVVFFQVGDVIVILQFAGPTSPPKELLDDAQMGILERVAPEQFTSTKDVGAQPLPTEPTTTTTSTTLPPTTTVPPTTTAKPRARKPKATTTAPPATTAPTTPAPPAGQ
ncbi:MAG TPA: hypothetical protein VJM33_05515 [Microthrixaceae bacterium]|nr:hypothetical protein [Microthrixaceae bacterium]